MDVVQTITVGIPADLLGKRRTARLDLVAGSTG
jgi:hypothetical protein